MERNIYTMKLHETLEIDNGVVVLRVAGGWIYEYYEEQYLYKEIKEMVFVPFSDEYDPRWSK